MQRGSSDCVQRAVQAFLDPALRFGCRLRLEAESGTTQLIPERSARRTPVLRLPADLWADNAGLCEAGSRRARETLAVAVWPSGIADENAAGVAADDLEDGGGPEGPLSGLHLDRTSDELGGQGAGTVAGGTPAAPGNPGRMPAGEGRRQGSGVIEWRSARCVCCREVALKAFE